MKYIKEVVLVTVFVVLVQMFMQRDMRSGDIPPLVVKTLSGMDSAGLIANKPTVIYFWGSWCGICKAIQNTISAVLQDYPGVTVALRSGNKASVLNYLQSNNLDWQVINDNEGALAQQFGVTAVPAVFIVGVDGQISFVTLGYVTEMGLRLRLGWLELEFSQPDFGVRSKSYTIWQQLTN